MAKQKDETGRVMDTETQSVPTRQGDKVGGHRSEEKHQLNVNYQPERAVDWNPNR